MDPDGSVAVNGGRGRRAEVTLVDPHAHLWKRFDVARFLDGASANVTRSGAAGTRRHAVLVLADAAGQDGLGRLVRFREDGAAGGRWRLRGPGPDGALVARRAGPAGVGRLVLVPGRQIRASGGVEVLSLGARPDVPEGLPLAETVRRVAASGGRALVPWGFGKWWLGRGRAVRDLVGRWSSPELFLGDTAGRPRGWPEPPLFREGRARGVRVLPGSDPLPVRGHERRAARYGFVLEGPPDRDRPLEWLLARLDGLPRDPPSFGRRVSAAGFVRDQVALRVG